MFTQSHALYSSDNILTAMVHTPCSQQSSDPTLAGSLEERLGKAKSSNSLYQSPEIHYEALLDIYL